MFGTEMARKTSRRWGHIAELMNGTSGVFAVLAVSGCVSLGAAWVAVDYITSPFDGDAGATAQPAVQTGLEPFPAPEAGTTGRFAGFSDAVPAAAAPGPAIRATATSHAATPSAPMLFALVEGRPPVLALPRPDTGPDILTLSRSVTVAAARNLPGPEARPGGTEMAAAIQAALGTVAAENPGGPASGASTFAAPGLAASLRPETRPAGFATVVASARRPVGEEAASGVTVARAAAPEVEITPARLETRPGPAIGGLRNPCSNRLARSIPSRPRNAQGGSQLVADLQGMGGADRDARIIRAAADGNVPDFLRNLRPVTFTGTTSGGSDAVVTICVSPDYLSVGSDRDFVRVPLGLPAALQIADRFDMMLPTPRMVDAIYAQADLHLRPQPMSPGAQMVTTGYFMQHDAMIDEQHARTGTGLGVLVAGHKKDLVLTNRLSSNPGQVAIYGWHRGNGNPIQPLSTVHGAQYADYSHGIRLVSRTAFVNGQAVDLGQLMTDSRYAGIVSDEGPIAGRAVQIASLR
ncbi:hypothetical protein HKCCE3408_12205 [Rhodobacterales bacterium HKCCE3408]|nr:hypothetical protein [Rhodobacterales bacterium HKCCE3408]